MEKLKRIAFYGAWALIGAICVGGLIMFSVLLYKSIGIGDVPLIAFMVMCLCFVLIVTVWTAGAAVDAFHQAKTDPHFWK